MRKHLAASVILILAFSLSASADSLTPVVPANPGQTVTYHIDFAGTFWNGEKQAFQRDITLTRNDGDKVAVEFDGQQNSIASGSVQTDGSIAFSDLAKLSAINSAAVILHNVPTSFKQGDSWQMTVPIFSGASIIAVPMKVTVAKIVGSQTELQATGTKTAMATYSGFTTPIDLSVQAAILLANGAFSQSQFALQEVVRAGPQEQTLKWGWKLSAK